MLTLYDLGRTLPADAVFPAPRLPASQRITAVDRARQALAAVLRALSALLARQARQVVRPVHAKQRRLAALADAAVEFHAEAGAPEGALYVDGRLAGYLDVRRL